MKIQFDCNNCLESFNVTNFYLSKKTSIVCPNCSNEFPSESFDGLKQGFSLIEESRSKMSPEHTTRGYTKRFDFTVIDD